MSETQTDDFSDVTVLSDCDDVIVRLVESWLAEYEETTSGFSPPIESIKEYALEQYFDNKKALWAALPEATRNALPNQNVIDAYKAWPQKINLVTTITPKCSYTEMLDAKCQWLRQYCHIPANLLLSSSSESRAALPGDVLIDDCPDNLDAWLASSPTRVVVCSCQPWNKKWRHQFSAKNRSRVVLLYPDSDSKETVTLVLQDACLRVRNLRKEQQKESPVKQERINNPDQTGKSAGEGIKYDAHKAPLWWVPSALEEGVSRVMHFGSLKYAAHNWRKGMKWTRLLSATFRHLRAWAEGQDIDPETGLSHLAHAACDIAFLMTYERDGLGEDDRGFKKETK